MINAGSLVICVDDNFPVRIWEWASELPRRGEVYTVREVDWGRNPITGEEGIGFVLFELDNPLFYMPGQVQFAEWRFREHFEDGEEQDECSESLVDELCEA